MNRISILGVKISAIDMLAAIDAIQGWIERREPQYVCVAPAHAILDYRRHPQLIDIANRSGMTTPDGMSIVWLLRFLGQPHVARVYGPDLMLECCRVSPMHGWKHYLYGGAPGIAARLKAQLEKRFPGVSVAGTYTPPFRDLTSDEDRHVISAINASGADIVWVGLSTPKQERWMAAHIGRIQAPVLIGVGAAFDFLSGAKPQAPRWMQRSGLEWLFRLATEPRRLWRRYAEYPLFAALVVAQLLGFNHRDGRDALGSSPMDEEPFRKR